MSDTQNKYEARLQIGPYSWAIIIDGKIDNYELHKTAADLCLQAIKDQIKAHAKGETYYQGKLIIK